MFKFNKNLLITILLVVGCTSINKAKLSSDTPKDAILEVQNLRDSSRRNQIDLLANKQFENGERRLESAIIGLEENEKRSDILEKLSQSKAYGFS